jgi:hypothetical protein
MLYQKYDQSTISLFSKEVHVDQNAGKNKLSGGSGKAKNSSLKTALLQYFKNFNVSDENIKFGTVDDNANNIEVRLNSNSKKSLEFLYNKESALNLLVDEGLFEKGTNQIVDALTWEKGMQELEIDGSFYLVVFEDILDPQPKELTKVRGTVISDYQNYLEKTWIQELKTTYKVEINEHTLDQIKTTFKKKLHSPD